MEIMHGDAYDLVSSFDCHVFDHVITDPPYGIGITRNEATVGRPRWDSGAAAFDPEMWMQVRRVTKPGGNLVAFGHPRTYHLLATAVEDAGWHIVDCLSWTHGQGLVARPRWLDREILRVGGDPDLAAAYTGYATALRPAHEMILLARKSRHHPPRIPEIIRDGGVGGFNIDALRGPAADDRVRTHGRVGDAAVWRIQRPVGSQSTPHPGGRYPSNVILGHEPACTQDDCLPPCPVALVRQQGQDSRGRGEDATRFYTVLHHPKAAPAERPGPHAAVKPLGVMNWLVRLVAKPGQQVLDPFSGTGTTLQACREYGVDSVGIERDPRTVALSQRRLGLQD